MQGRGRVIYSRGPLALRRRRLPFCARRLRKCSGRPTFCRGRPTRWQIPPPWSRRLARLLDETILERAIVVGEQVDHLRKLVAQGAERGLDVAVVGYER